MDLFKKAEKTEEEKQKAAERKALLLIKIEKIILELSAVLAIIIAWNFTKHGSIPGIAGLISVIRMAREDKNWMKYLFNKILGITEIDNKEEQTESEANEKKE